MQESIEAEVELSVDGVYMGAVELEKGVKQGCPISSLLFQVTMNWALGNIHGSVGGKRDSEFMFTGAGNSL